VLEAEHDRETPAASKARIEEMLKFVATITEWFDDVKALPRPTLVALMKMGAKIAALVPKSVVRKLHRAGAPS
jgi:hypothetical protein